MELIYDSKGMLHRLPQIAPEIPEIVDPITLRRKGCFKKPQPDMLRDEKKIAEFSGQNAEIRAENLSEAASVFVRFMQRNGFPEFGAGHLDAAVQPFRACEKLIYFGKTPLAHSSMEMTLYASSKRADFDIHSLSAFDIDMLGSILMTQEGGSQNWWLLTAEGIELERNYFDGRVIRLEQSASELYPEFLRNIQSNEIGFEDDLTADNQYKFSYSIDDARDYEKPETLLAFAVDRNRLKPLNPCEELALRFGMTDSETGRVTVNPYSNTATDLICAMRSRRADSKSLYVGYETAKSAISSLYPESCGICYHKDGVISFWEQPNGAYHQFVCLKGSETDFPNFIIGSQLVSAENLMSFLKTKPSFELPEQLRKMVLPYVPQKFGGKTAKENSYG